MKMNNLLKLHTLLLMLVVSSVMILASCKDDDDEIVQGDKTELNALIAEAEALVASATTADYPQSAIDAFNSTLSTVKTAAATPLTQAEIDNLETQLTVAMNTFDTQAYGFIDESLYLNAGWHFDEGTGTTATAFSTIKHVGTFKKGITKWGVPGTTMPTWATGLKGGNAIKLNDGAHLEVPFNQAFLPNDITISVWVKIDSIYCDNYIVSQNYWQGYKFQTQCQAKAFFTFAKTDGGIVDKDNALDNSAQVGVWSHLVVSLNSTTSTLKFYVNGSLAKTWTSVDGIGPLTRAPKNGPDGALVAENLPFLIGAAASDETITGNNWNWAGKMSFQGALDELKIYNIALADGQVSKLYNDEKP
ncbi:MAG: LamG domain-containing protein [Lentimicrobium sp.]